MRPMLWVAGAGQDRVHPRQGLQVRYIPPFDLLLSKAQVTEVAAGRHVSLTYEDFLDILRRIIADIDVDEAWYLRTNPGVARGIEAGTIKSARQHFVDHGYFEGRLPCPVIVDEVWYLTKYPDVADDLRHGRIDSAQGHFDQDGYREGRIPFSLEA